MVRPTQRLVELPLQLAPPQIAQAKHHDLKAHAQAQALCDEDQERRREMARLEEAGKERERAVGQWPY